MGPGCSPTEPVPPWSLWSPFEGKGHPDSLCTGGTGRPAGMEPWDEAAGLQVLAGETCVLLFLGCRQQQPLQPVPGTWEHMPFAPFSPATQICVHPTGPTSMPSRVPRAWISASEMLCAPSLFCFLPFVFPLSSAVSSLWAVSHPPAEPSDLDAGLDLSWVPPSSAALSRHTTDWEPCPRDHSLLRLPPGAPHCAD